MVRRRSRAMAGQDDDCVARMVEAKKLYLGSF
jgi:hypothetical protein